MTARRARSRPGGSPCLVLPYAVADGARNMAVDEAMLELASGGATLLRFYGWEPWCLSLGRHQPIPTHLLRKLCNDVRPGVDAVRRPTGGRAVLHGPEVTYALACPDRAWGGPKQVRNKIHSALGEGLRSLGVRIDVATAAMTTADHASKAGRLSSAACFRDAAPGELTVGGRKVVGSAQCRRSGAVLQHGSILLDDHQGWAELDGPGWELGSTLELGPWPERVSASRSAIGLREALHPDVDPLVVVERLTATLTAVFGRTAKAATACTALADLAARYESDHRSADRLRRHPLRA